MSSTSSIDVTDWLRRAGVVLAGVGVALYALVVVGRGTGSAIFLGLTASTLVMSVLLLAGAIRSLFTEPPTTEAAVATGRRRKELEREKAALLKAIKELEFDHEMRKVSDADFEEIGGNYRARAIRVMRQLDQGGNDYERMVREEVGKLRRGKPAASDVAESDSATGPESVAESVPVSVAAPVVASANCPSCGTANDADAIFCKKCAHRLVATEGVA